MDKRTRTFLRFVPVFVWLFLSIIAGLASIGQGDALHVIAGLAAIVGAFPVTIRTFNSLTED